LKRNIIITADGSSTIHISDWDEHYHSKHGAIQEAKHVFIKNGLHFLSIPNVAILEIGFGTGLNSFITFLEALKLGLTVNYVGIEAYPVPINEINCLNYVAQLNAEAHKSTFQKMHQLNWEVTANLSANFTLTKRKQLFESITDTEAFNLIYFDAFGARVQPELWTELIFKKMYQALKKDGVLVTYSAKGSVRRALQTVGFFVEKLPGPPGKREMLRAIKK
jgi:tRNA U34 5-methylaminomethyl-2-thiouridine-forming methyltransferase MnmC